MVTDSPSESRSEHRSIQHSLYFKLAASFMLLLLVIGIVQIYISTVSLRSLVREIAQKIYWNAAPEFANELQPSLLGEVNLGEAERKLRLLWQANPMLEFFILDEDGQVVADYSQHEGLERRRIDTTPIRRALEVETPLLPLLGQSPTKATHDLRPFSAASLQLGERPGYLYIVLEGGLLSYLATQSGGYFVLRGMAFGILAIAVIAIGGGILLFAYVTRHFRALGELFAEYERGEFSKRLEVIPNDEIGDVAAAAHTMAARIERSTQELREADQYRRRLVAAIAHDLRNPLAAVKGSVEELRAQEPGQEAGRLRYYEIIAKGIRSQEALVADLFELSRLETAEAQLEIEQFPITELAEDTVLQLQPAAQKRGIELRCLMPDSLPHVYGDIMLLERVLGNLISNAIRFTGSGGEVEVALEHSNPESVAVSVRDTGAGIPEHDLEHIFEAFYRADSARSGEGTGLGLAIVKRALELHSAPIDVRSRVGEGTVFRFELSTAPPQAQQSNGTPTEL